MESAEGEGVVEQDAAVGDVGCGDEAEMFSVKDLPRARSKVVCWGKYALGYGVVGSGDPLVKPEP